MDPTTGHGPEWGEAAPIGLLVIVLMCVAVYFLVKSLNRNLKKVPESFDEAPITVGAPVQTAGEAPAVDGQADQVAQHDPGSPPSSAAS